MIHRSITFNRRFGQLISFLSLHLFSIESESISVSSDGKFGGSHRTTKSFKISRIEDSFKMSQLMQKDWRKKSEQGDGK